MLVLVDKGADSILLYGNPDWFGGLLAYIEGMEAVIYGCGRQLWFWVLVALPHRPTWYISPLLWNTY